MGVTDDYHKRIIREWWVSMILPITMLVGLVAILMYILST